MRFDIITLFPELFAPLLSHGINRRAFESRQVDVRLWQLRDFAEGNYRRVDDRPFGGGPGMVMQADPLLRCWQAIRADRGADLPGAEPAAAAAVAERLRQAVAAHDWSALAPGLQVRISGGLAQRMAGEDFEALSARADAALYQAKQQGRNQVVRAA